MAGLGRYPNGKGSYAQKRAMQELFDYIGTLEKRIVVLEEAQAVMLKEEKGSVENEVAKVKPLEKQTKADLAKLAAEYGIDDSAFKTKEDYVKALKEKDETLQ